MDHVARIKLKWGWVVRRLTDAEEELEQILVANPDTYWTPTWSIRNEIKWLRRILNPPKDGHNAYYCGIETSLHQPSIPAGL